MSDLRGKVALITGGRRIGADIAETLARAGVNVVLTYLKDPGEMIETKNRCEGHGAVCRLERADVSQETAVNQLIDKIIKNFGRLDILINMASIYRQRPFNQLTGDDFDEDLTVNAKSAFLTSLRAMPEMKKNGWGRIINFADWIVASGRPNYTTEGYVTYYTAKGAVIKLTEALALEGAADNITVNAVAPGPILPPPDLSPAEVAAVMKATPLGRWGGVAEITKAVMFFINSEFVTGETIRVDGGRHLK